MIGGEMNAVEICGVVLCGITFAWVMTLGLTGLSKGDVRLGFDGMMHRMAAKGRNLAWYEKTQQWLTRNGAKFHVGEKFGPLAYQVSRIFLGAAGFMAFSMMAPSYGIVAGVAFFCLPGGLIHYVNAKDNLKMLPDLKHTYHSLEIQTRAGVFVTDALAELYGSVRERRLKQALLELSGDLVMHSDLGAALESFQKKFDNRYVDSLCMIIVQAMESGQSVELLNDLSEQIKDMEASVLSQKKEALDRSVTFYQLGILVAIMGVILYACVTQMFAAALHF